MTKSELVKAVAQQAGLTHDQVSAVLSNAVITIDRTLADGGDLELTPFESYVIYKLSKS